jgi:CheY-like chemotaxis protein
MTPRTVRLLHVEDDPVGQRLTAQQLTTLGEFQFAITYADSEDAALTAFDRGGTEFVLLDYHLNQGNGLSCLRQLRQRDPVVPIVALSGMATPEIAAELLRVGADDYLGKQDLTTEALARSVRDALARADAWRQHAPVALSGEADAARKQFEDLCRTFAARLGPEFLARVDAFEAAARRADFTAAQMQQSFLDACLVLDHPGSDAGNLRRALRPLLLEVLLRLFGDSGPGGLPSDSDHPGG